MSAPVVPQRPTRSQNQASSSSTTADTPIPQVPPRPNRNVEKSMSPSRSRDYARSPLNEPYQHAPLGGATNGFGRPPQSMQKRPSIASLPLIGHEGDEYDSLDQVPQLKKPVLEVPGTPQDTRNVAGDLPLHAPKATATAASAVAQVAPLVRTDTGKASELGIGKSAVEDDFNDLSLRHTTSRSREFRPVSSSGLSHDITRELSRSTSRTGVVELDEHGIPHIGQHVPMYPNAGDVQAPSPSPWQSGQATGVGFFNDTSRPATQDGRRKSAAGFHGPPGSYGLHGHGMTPQDKFERAWYQRHPDELKKEEQGAYGPIAALQRPEWALSSEELNQLVRSSSQPGFGTSDKVVSAPTEAIGYKASAEYSSRINSPALQPTKSRRTSQQMESPLRKASLPEEKEIDDDRIALDPPPRKTDRYTGQGYDPPTVDLGPEGGNNAEKGGYIHERGTGTPILASDEIRRNPGAEYQQPAVSPEAAKHGDGEYFSDDDKLPAWQRRPGSAGGRNSRRNSRPSSAHFHHYDVPSTGTPLNEIEEYEPLFNDEEDQASKRPLTIADKLKRPDVERHRFPSQDIWEDTPNSLQLQTTVSGPQEVEETIKSPSSSKGNALFEHPDKEQARRGEITEPERLSFLDDSNGRKAKPKFNAGVQEEIHRRPGMRNRFPSQDIWEDTPDSLQLHTTVDPEDTQLKSATGEAVPAENNLAQGFAAADRSMAGPQETPMVPQRPSRTKPTEQPTVTAQPSQSAAVTSPTKANGPTLPERPKPQIPARPTRAAQGSQSDGSEVTSPTESIAATIKAKPSAPSKPAQSSKFASIKAGFMNDLNSRLQLGPQAPKQTAAPEAEPEVEEEKAPLVDARKGRARGPARRQPQVAVAAPGAPSFSIMAPRTHWSIGHAGLHTASSKGPASSMISVPTQETSSSSLEPDTVEGTLAETQTSHEMMDLRAQQEEADSFADFKEHEMATAGAEGDVPNTVPASLDSKAIVTSVTNENSAVQTGEVQMSSAMEGETESHHEITAYVDGGKAEGSTVLVSGETE